MAPSDDDVRLIEVADKIDNRLGRLPGGEMDRLAVLLRKTAEHLAAVVAERDAAIAERDRLRDLAKESLPAISAAIAAENLWFQGRKKSADRQSAVVQNYRRKARAAINPEAKP